MLDHGYRRALVDAGFISATGYGKGIQAWRSDGLRCARLLERAFAREVHGDEGPAPVSHPSFTAAADFRALFPDHDNVVTLELAGRETLVCPDFLLPNLRGVLATGSADPVIAFGGLQRAVKGRTPAGFKDSYIWPVVQLNQAVPRAVAHATLREHARALAALLHRLCLPGVVVRATPPAHYATDAWLAVSCLPDGSLTILATLYRLAPRFQQFLRTDHELIDLGFTGKVIAVAAMHHRDARGLLCPSELAPVQALAIPHRSISSAAVRTWAAGVAADGIRVEVAPPAAKQSHAWRSDRQGRRRGIPILLGYDAEREPRALLGLRTTEARAGATELPSSARLRMLLSSYDDQLRLRSGRRWDELVRPQSLTHLCAGCAQRQSRIVLGQIEPVDWARCRCGAARAPLRLLTDRRRIY